MNHPNQDCEVVVVGCGGMGAAACCHLAARGVDVIGLERFARCHDHGSSHGHSRVVRRAYFEHPDYVPLLVRAFELWNELGDRTGLDCIHQIGALFCGQPESEVYAQSLASARAHGLEVEDLDPKQLAARFPQFALPDGMCGVYEPDAGFVIPENGIEAHLRLAEEGGAEIREGVRVDSIEGSDAGVTLQTSQGSIRASRVVVAAGAWTNRLLGDIGIPLEVHRKMICWFEALQPDACAESRMPAWIVGGDLVHSQGDYYGIPTWDGQSGPAGVKVGCHGPGTPIDPDTDSREAPPAEIDRFERDVQALLPGVLGRIVETATCLYTMTPDGHFVIGALPEEPRIVVAGGFSGHGYKFAPVMGEVLADLAMDGGTRLPVGFLGISPDRC